MRWVTATLVTLVSQGLQMVMAARILALCTVTSHSHSLWCYKYMAALAERGHQITVLGLDEPKITVPGIRTFIAEGVYEAVHSQENMQVYKTMSKSVIHTLKGILLWLQTASEKIFQSRAFKDLIEQHKGTEKPFDLIIHDGGSCASSILGLVPIFGNPPVVIATTYGSPQWMTFRVGNIFNPAYVSSMMTNFKPNMNWYERLLNTYYYVATEWFVFYWFEWQEEILKRKVFGEGIPHVRDLAKRANVVILNYNPVFDQPRPLLPGVIGIAGLHIDEPKPLPQDIKEFMDGARHGVILLSFGTNIDSTWFPEDFEDEVVKAFEHLPQRVIWKWNKTPKNISPNVRIESWLPQADILVHPNLRLFATHCGLLSTQEAIFRKVPMLALPTFIDQYDNAALLVRLKLTIQLDIHTMTASHLTEAVREILNNPMYKENIVRMGELMQDMPQTAKQQAVYWTEYAIRHDGASHLRSAAADMPWYQLLLLDVIGLIVTVTLIALWLIYYVLSFVIRKFTSKEIKSKTE